MKTWRCNLKKKRILQDESLELWFKRNELTYKCWYKWSMKTSEKMTKKKWENSSNTWFLSNAYLREHHRELWAFYIFHFITQTQPTLQSMSKDLLEVLLIVGASQTLIIFFSWIKKEKMLKIVKPHRIICSRTKFLKFSNPQND